jgi:hypothetical protein
MRARMMSIDVLSVSAEMPTLGRCSGLAKLGAAEAWDRAPEVRAPRQRDGRVALPDTRARASETERQSESELVVEAARHYKRPETWWTWVVGSNLAALWDGGGLHPRVLWGVDGREDPAIASRMGCSGIAGCRPGQTDHGERGKHPVRAGGGGRRQDAMSVDACWVWRSPRSSRRGRESRPHGEGGQQVRGCQCCSGGRT